MERKDAKYKWFLLGLLSFIFLFSILVRAQNYKYQDTTKTDTNKTDTSHTRKKKLGFNNIKFNSLQVLRSEYAFTGNIGNSEYFIDTTKPPTDTTKKDTLGYNNIHNDNVEAYNNNSTNENYSVPINNKSSKFKIYAVRNLTEKLKHDVNLTVKQIPEVKSILREYEAKTYESSGNNDDVNEAANNTQKNINEILTSTQKKEWQKIKKDWWVSVNKELNLSSINNNTHL